MEVVRRLRRPLAAATLLLACNSPIQLGEPSASPAPIQSTPMPSASKEPWIRWSPEAPPGVSDASPAPTVTGRSPEPTREPTTAKPSWAPTIANARRYALTYLGRVQFACLDAIFQRESHWQVNATNRTSGAYGIPQALPGSKMASAGADWRTNPVTQVKWGIGYVNGRYGSACNAWQHVLQFGWY